MTEKTRILGALNEQALLLPSLVNRALAANDRVNYRFALLQAAQAHAEHPDAVTSSLRAERLAAGVTESALDSVVGQSERLGQGRYRIPSAARIVRDALDDVAEMLEPLSVVETGDSADYARRYASFPAPADEADTLSAEAILALTSGDRARGDSELADVVRAGLEAAQAGRGADVAAMSERARDWETAADRELNAARATQQEGDHFILDLMNAADDIADDLEEAVFHLTLSPQATPDALGALARLVEPVARASRELVKALAASRYARRGVPREDMDDFLQAIHAIRTMEHTSDLAERALVDDARPYAEVFGIVEAARNLEEAADGLMHVALLLRDHVMGKVIHA